jgi:2-methylcitrate dehydratase PrpD
MQATRTLAEFASRTRYEDLPRALVERAKVYVLDNLATGFVGAGQPWTRIVAGLAQSFGGRADASVFGAGERCDVSRAALVNGTAIGAFELEHIGYSTHPSATVFPAALALAERDHRDGRAFLTGLLAGYEVVCRIGRAQTPAVERERGFHNPAANGPFGAAAAAGSLLGLGDRELASALGIAGSSAGGLTEFVWEGAMTKRLHMGRAAQLGLESALLAQRGFTGPSTVLEGRYGYFAAFSPRPALERLLSGLGETWLAEDLSVKAYPCHITGQAVAHALQHYRARRGRAPDEIKAVTIAAGPRLLEERYWDRAPRTVLGAQYSLPYTAALALTGDLMSADAFSKRALEDPAVRALARRIAPRPEAAGGNDADVARALDADITIETADGPETLAAPDFPGAPSRPLDLDGAAEKFRRYTGQLVDPPRAREIIDMVRGLDRLADVALLAGHIRA